MTFHTNHKPRPKHHPWKAGASYRMARGRVLAERKAAKERGIPEGKNHG